MPIPAAQFVSPVWMMERKLGILAGGGQLPALIIQACKDSAREYFVIAFKEQADPILVSSSPHAWVRLGAAGEAIRTLKNEDVEDLVFAGGISRPSMSQFYPDLWTAKFLARTRFMDLGDDGVFSTLIKTLESELGFKVVSAESVVPDLLATIDLSTHTVPSALDTIDIQLAVQAAQDLGRQDKGQAAIACNGSVIGLEDHKGTDALINHLTSQRGGDVRGGVLAKVAKPQQELRIDLPTIGIKTVEVASNAGLNGIVIEAGRSLIIDREEVLSLADKLGLFVKSVNVDEIVTHGE